MRWPSSPEPTDRLAETQRRLEYWAVVVDEIEAGYGLTIDDYLNDLDIHATLAEQVAALGPEDPLRSRLEQLDDRYEAATRPVDARTTRGTRQVRVPLHPAGQLPADLRDRGWT